MSQDRDYGKCDSCNQPFVYGDEIVHLSIQGCGQSQGYENFWQMGTTVHLHQLCFKMIPQREVLWFPFKRKPELDKIENSGTVGA